MASQAPAIPKGTRDFGPDEVLRRNYIFNTIRQVFEKFGFQPIETPAMENLSTLLGKYGAEGDKLLFRILNSGDFLSDVQEDILKNKDSQKASGALSEKGLRYDLTVPFARFVVQHFNDISFPFRRYQIQPVWRADRPQKGRYREFFQCDADVIGSDSLLIEADLVQIIHDVFASLNTQVKIKLNNRKILTGIAGMIGEADKIIDITVAIDKIEKIGIDKVNEELKISGISSEGIEKLQPILKAQGSNAERLDLIRECLKDQTMGLKGISEMEELLGYIQHMNLSTQVELDLSLARGLEYYTGTIFEVKSLEMEIGSICGGGRYDNLTGIFGRPGISGVGISFGADRIFDVLSQTKKFPESASRTTQILFVNFGAQEALHCLQLIRELHRVGISAELYPDSSKMKKQLDYANRKGIPFVALVGEEEMKTATVTLKDMTSGTQTKKSIQEIAQELRG